MLNWIAPWSAFAVFQNVFDVSVNASYVRVLARRGFSFFDIQIAPRFRPGDGHRLSFPVCKTKPSC